MTVIALDAMGSDDAPMPEVAGALAAVRESPAEVVLVGDEPRLRQELQTLGARTGDRVRVRHASQVIGGDDAPGRAFRDKRDSSLRIAFELVKGGAADAVVSAGNSGAVLAHGIFVLGRLPGVERPAIITVLPTPVRSLVLCDVGANVDIKPSMLAQFGVFGACYDRVVHRRPRPRVAILANGTEAKKGTAITRVADQLLRHAAAVDGAAFDYRGYIEGSALWSGDVDVVATDGFTGNVVLKLAEGMAEAMLRMVAASLDRSARGKLGAALIRPALNDVAKRIDYAEVGGALLVGVDGVVSICHGRSDLNAIKNAIKGADRFVRAGLTAELGAAIARQPRLWQAPDVTASGSA